MTDPISDMLSRIRNAVLVRKPEVVVPHSRFKADLAELLVAAGYLGGVEEIALPQRSLKIKLVYKGGQPVIRSLKRISTPGRRLYAKNTELPRVLSGLGIAVISTSQGLMTNLEARRKHLGGEVVCEVY
jgi:small subunit ribosomal protein S8